MCSVTMHIIYTHQSRNGLVQPVVLFAHRCAEISQKRWRVWIQISVRMCLSHTLIIMAVQLCICHNNTITGGVGTSYVLIVILLLV